jgi:hypothetical protein
MGSTRGKQSEMVLGSSAAGLDKVKEEKKRKEEQK